MRKLFSLISVYLVLFTVLIPVKAQYDTLSNFDKYKIYKKRFEERYIVKGDPLIPGSYIPVEWRVKDICKFADATIWMGYYMAILATEYRLLKDNGQDASETLTELKNAVTALIRLDLGAEKAFLGKPSLNGFFLRDDVDENFGKNFTKCESHEMRSDYIEKGEHLVMSQDQVWNLLYGLQMIIKLVDDEELQEVSKSISYVMIRRIHYVKKIGPFKDRRWELRNPVTDEVVQPWYFNIGVAHGFGEAGSKILNRNCHFASSEKGVKKFVYKAAMWTIQFQLDRKKFIFKSWYGRPYNATGIAVLAMLGDIQPSKRKSTIQFLDELTFEGKPVYDFLPLSYYIINEKGSFPKEKVSYLENLLNIAPVYGPRNIEHPAGCVPEWAKLNNQFCPWQIGTKWREFNGMDYMLLHNLYLLTFMKDKGFYKLSDENPSE